MGLENVFQPPTPFEKESAPVEEPPTPAAEPASTVELPTPAEELRRPIEKSKQPPNELQVDLHESQLLTDDDQSVNESLPRAGKSRLMSVSELSLEIRRNEAFTPIEWSRTSSMNAKTTMSGVWASALKQINRKMDAMNAAKAQSARPETRADQAKPRRNSKEASPKRRRTKERVSTTAKENDSQEIHPSQSPESLSLLQKSLMEHGFGRRSVQTNPLRSPSTEHFHRPNAPTPNHGMHSGGSMNPSFVASSPAPSALPQGPAVPVVTVSTASAERRKGSLTTHDFMTEATRVMAMIRANGKNPGGLSTAQEAIEESEQEISRYEEESTQDQFSRPPSREGVDLRQIREPKPINARILNHLQKFQETDAFDLEDMSLRLEQSLNADLPEHDRSRELAGIEDVEIDEDVLQQRKRKYCPPSATDEESKSLSTRSIPTGTSQNSQAKGILPSDVVSHLIPQQVNGLTFDPMRRQWVKTEDSEGDPFEDIPDLSVDEKQDTSAMGLDLTAQHSVQPTPFRTSAARSVTTPQPRPVVISSTPRSRSMLFTSTPRERSLVRHPTPQQGFGLQLSALSEFTVSNDQPMHFEVSYVGPRAHSSALHQVQGTFALATENLVKGITEAEPCEPYWESIRRLVLREKGLNTVHKLNEFCPRLEYLDVSVNGLCQLDGIPPSVRTLTIQGNRLSDLTSWGQLSNLQYLDVSGNDLETLNGFESLVHLRELKASDNNIRHIDGIKNMDGLLSLKLDHNALVAVDFEDSDL